MVTSFESRREAVTGNQIHRGSVCQGIGDRNKTFKSLYGGRKDGTRCMGYDDTATQPRTWLDSSRLTQALPSRIRGLIISEGPPKKARLSAHFSPKVPEALKLEKQIRNLEARIEEQLQRSQGTEIALEAIRLDDELLLKQRDLRHLLDRVCEPAQTVLLGQGPLLDRFESTSLEDAFVMSIDIRRSTELMLKAREPQLFADFITELCIQLGGIIVDNLGVFDKFTGDGILAFFPMFFSGEDAGYLAVKAAEECHAAFTHHYAANRKCFTTILKDTGLGIGIDYGKVRLGARSRRGCLEPPLSTRADWAGLKPGILF